MRLPGCSAGSCCPSFDLTAVAGFKPGCKRALAPRTGWCAFHQTTGTMQCVIRCAGLWAEAHQARESLLGFLTSDSEILKPIRGKTLKSCRAVGGGARGARVAAGLPDARQRRGHAAGHPACARLRPRPRRRPLPQPAGGAGARGPHRTDLVCVWGFSRANTTPTSPSTAPSAFRLCRRE